MKHFLSVLALSLITVSAWAQVNSLGPAVGINYAWISNQSDAIDAHGIVAPVLGVNYIYSSAEKWGFGVGAFFSQEGSAYNADGVLLKEDSKVTLEYIRVPLKGIFFFNTIAYRFRPKAFLGPSLGFLLSAHTKVGDADRVKLEDRNKPNSFDLGITGGVGFNYKLASRTWLNFDLGYTHGLIGLANSDLNVDRDNDTFNRNINATIGISFGF